VALATSATRTTSRPTRCRSFKACVIAVTVADLDRARATAPAVLADRMEDRARRDQADLHLDRGGHRARTSLSFNPSQLDRCLQNRER
jgi:hypothetical protein